MSHHVFLYSVILCLSYRNHTVCFNAACHLLHADGRLEMFPWCCPKQRPIASSHLPVLVQVILYDQRLPLWFAEVLPEMENQGEYEGQNFNFTSPDNMDNGGSQNLTKLTTANMEDMEEYYNFGKDTSSYTTP